MSLAEDPHRALVVETGDDAGLGAAVAAGNRVQWRATFAERGWPHDDRADLAVETDVEPEDEHRGMGCDRAPHLVGEGEVARRFPMLVAQQPVGVLSDLLAFGGLEPGPNGEVLGDDAFPAVGQPMSPKHHERPA